MHCLYWPNYRKSVASEAPVLKHVSNAPGASIVPADVWASVCGFRQFDDAERPVSAQKSGLWLETIEDFKLSLNT